MSVHLDPIYPEGFWVTSFAGDDEIQCRDHVRALAGRRMLGDATEVAIKLDPDEALTMGLIAGEGIETCLAARQIGLRPAWALGSVGMISTLPVLSGVEALTLLAETDKRGANARAIETCGTRWHEAGRTVIVASPKFGGDVNDALQGKVA